MEALAQRLLAAQLAPFLERSETPQLGHTQAMYKITRRSRSNMIVRCGISCLSKRVIGVVFDVCRCLVAIDDRDVPALSGSHFYHRLLKLISEI